MVAQLNFINNVGISLISTYKRFLNEYGIIIHDGGSLFTVSIPSLTAITVIGSGPLNESALIFIVMPFGHFSSVFVGFIVGLVANAISKDNESMVSTKSGQD